MEENFHAFGCRKCSLGVLRSDNLWPSAPRLRSSGSSHEGCCVPQSAASAIASSAVNRNTIGSTCSPHRGCPDTRAASGTCSRRRGAFPDPAESGGLDGAFLDQRSLQRFEALVERVAVEVRPPGEESFLERRHQLVTHRRVTIASSPWSASQERRHAS